MFEEYTSRIFGVCGGGGENERRVFEMERVRILACLCVCGERMRDMGV